MKKILVLAALICQLPNYGQQLNSFTFPELDANMIAVWSTAYHNQTEDLGDEIEQATKYWFDVRQQIESAILSHFASDHFILDQHKLLMQMKEANAQKQFDRVHVMAYDFIKAFREVRTFFTSDLYALDELFVAFDLYQEVHYAVDDPMLGLYEWKQFTSLFHHFKEQFGKYVVIAGPGFDQAHAEVFQAMVQRVWECTDEFEASLKTAMQDEFVLPCDDTHKALVALIEIYRDQYRSVQ